MPRARRRLETGTIDMPSSMPGASAATAAIAVRALVPAIWESQKLAEPSAAARMDSSRL